MAAQVKIVRGTDFAADVAALDLYSNATGLTIREWTPSVDGLETLTVQAAGTDDNNLAAILLTIDDQVRALSDSLTDKNERYQVWLRDQLSAETNARQSALVALRGAPNVGLHAPPVNPGSFLSSYTLSLRRQPWWEPTSHTTYNIASVPTIATPTAYLGGANPSSVPGAMSARIARLLIKPTSTSALNEGWFGFRTNRLGTAANLQPTWECENGSVSGGTTKVADATASGGGACQCTFTDASDPDYLERVQIAVDDVTTDYNDQRGRFIVLLRCKVDASTTVRARIESGVLSSELQRYHEYVDITNTNYRLIEMGTIDIPGTAVNIPLEKFGLEIIAKRTAGSGDFWMDCFYLIPVGEGGLFYTTGGPIGSAFFTTERGEVYHNPLGQMNAWRTSASLGNWCPTYNLEITPLDYGLPVGTAGYVVYAAQASGGPTASAHSLTNSANLELAVFPRYRHLRGNT